MDILAMDHKKYVSIGIGALFLIILLFLLIPSAQMPTVISHGKLSASTPQGSNTTISVGQSSSVNTTISGGEGQYSGEWTWINSNQVNFQQMRTINFSATPGLAFYTPSGRYAYIDTAGDRLINVINVSENATIATIPMGGGNWAGVQPNPNSSIPFGYLPVANEIEIISTSTNKVVGAITGIKQYYISSAGTFNPSGTLFYLGGYQHNYVISTATNEILYQIPCNGVLCGSTGFAFNPSGSTAYSVGQFAPGNLMVVYNVSTNTVIATPSIGAYPSDVRIGPSGAYGYVADWGFYLTTFNTSTYRITNTVYAAGYLPDWLALSPSGTIAYIAGGDVYNGPSGVVAVDLETDKIIGTVPFVNGDLAGDAISINPQGTLLYSTGSSNSMAVIGGLPESAVQPIPSSGQFHVGVDAVNNNTITFTFGGKTYTESTGSNTIYGTWTLYGFAQDNGTNPSYYGSNTLLVLANITVT